MAIRRAQISFQVGTNLPRDRMIVTPHYQTTGGTSDQTLADSLKSKLTAHVGIGVAVPFTVRVYNAQGPPPHYPLGSADNTGTAPKAVNGPRELALALSYYAGNNRPRFRGRLYVPMAFLSGSIGARPTSGQQTEAMGWGDMLFKSLPTDILPVVYSRVDDQGYILSNMWVDDEWDLQRMRGDRSTSRILGAIP